MRVRERERQPADDFKRLVLPGSAKSSTLARAWVGCGYIEVRCIDIPIYNVALSCSLLRAR